MGTFPGSISYKGSLIVALGSGGSGSVYWASGGLQSQGNTTLNVGGTITVNLTSSTYNAGTYTQSFTMLSENTSAPAQQITWASLNGTNVSN